MASGARLENVSSARSGKDPVVNEKIHWRDHHPFYNQFKDGTLVRSGVIGSVPVSKLSPWPVNWFPSWPYLIPLANPVSTLLVVLVSPLGRSHSQLVDSLIPTRTENPRDHEH
ncbi:hypothetical protein M9H77_35306 [Catharanthus roseus]|uniref:Uncharacterized protein n=1 Tax=Catharanthus roseus TaxID=4058 RepID=A0ACB9ZR81_CATRO|nr:hypothetical protein M9H77_35306 [Catharanthus roseus]